MCSSDFFWKSSLSVWCVGVENGCPMSKEKMEAKRCNLLGFVSTVFCIAFLLKKTSICQETIFPKCKRPSILFPFFCEWALHFFVCTNIWNKLYTQSTMDGQWFTVALSPYILNMHTVVGTFLRSKGTSFRVFV